MKHNCIICDPPYSFQDRLKMSDVKRGAEANYSVLTNTDIKNLNIQSVAANDAVLALWVPSSLLNFGLELMSEWKFKFVQTWIWNKVKQDPLKSLRKSISKKAVDKKILLTDANQCITEYNLNDSLAFGLGRTFRQSHEIALIGVKGKIYSHLKNKSQRSVAFDVNFKHSAKPETLHNRLELMFPNLPKLEIFGRRQKAGWTVIGNQAPMTFDNDIVDSLKKLSYIDKISDDFTEFTKGDIKYSSWGDIIVP